MKSKLTVLVTGGAGFIGSHLCEKLLNLGYKVIVFDNFQTGKLENLKTCMTSRDFFILQGDINSVHDSRELLKFDLDYIYHYAASVGVTRTLSQPLEVLDDIDGIRNILDLAREKQVRRVFYSSSSEVYGESVSFPQNEKSTPLNSKLPYAAVKNLGEIYLRTYHKEYGLNYTIFRFFNTFGPRQSAEFVVSRFIKQAQANKNLTLNGDGTQTRSFIYVSDNITATTNALRVKVSINSTINIGSPQELTMLDLAKLIISHTKSKSKIVKSPALKEGDMSRRVPDISFMQKILHAPRINFNAGLDKTIAYFSE